MMSVTPVLLLLSVCVGVTHGIFYPDPEQIHISYGRDPTQMVVTWSTKNDTKDSIVKYGLSPATVNMQATGQSHKFVDGGSEHRFQYIHNVVIQGLVPGQKYYYHCGSDFGWSDSFYFTAMKAGSDWSPRFVIYGDLGKVNGQSIPRLQRERDLYDTVLHVGDFAYNLDTNQSQVGDVFMNQIQPLAAYLPYMTCPGNHEMGYNFSSYKNRFSMPFDEKSGNMFYSFDVGPAHIISFSTEYYFYVNYGVNQLVRQYEWLKEELRSANLPENRAKHPWIITMGHRPMYCSTKDADDCDHRESRIRSGVPFLGTHIFGLEKMFNEFGVDIALWAHEHIYERFWPVYDRKVYNGSYDHPYTNPKAMVHVLTGSAGCQERHDNFQKHPGPWSAVRNKDYGYTRMTIYNSSHINFQQVSDDKNGKIVDDFTVIKDRHGSYGFTDTSDL